MQLTKLDHWLKERFIYETHIFTLRLPEQGLPSGVHVEDVDSKKSGAYRHKLVIKDNDLAEKVLIILKNNKLMYATHIVEGKHWYNERIAPQGSSFTYRWISRAITSICVCVVAWGVILLLRRPELIAVLEDTIHELKRGL